jgi:hypothetical protein
MKSRADRILEGFEAELIRVGMTAEAQALNMAIKKADTFKTALYLLETPRFLVRHYGRVRDGDLEIRQFVNELDSPALFFPDAPDEITVSQLAESERQRTLALVTEHSMISEENALQLVMQKVTSCPATK